MMILRMPIPRKLVCDCRRCGYAWVKRVDTTPRNCPRCKSPYWNVKRGKLQVGRPRKKAAKHAN